MSEPITTERIRTMICGRMGFVPQAFADEIQSLVAQAWDEGYRAAIEDYGCDLPWGGFTSDDNPYRTET